MRLLKAFSAIVFAVVIGAVMVLQYDSSQFDVYAQTEPTGQPGRALSDSVDPVGGPTNVFNRAVEVPDRVEATQAAPVSKGFTASNPNSDPRLIPAEPDDYQAAGALPGLGPDQIGASGYPGMPPGAVPANGSPATFPADGTMTTLPPGAQRVELETDIKRLGHLHAPQVAEVVQALFSDRFGFVCIAEPVTNALIIRADDETRVAVEQLLERLEDTQLQIEAEAKAANAEGYADMAVDQSMSMSPQPMQTQQRPARSTLMPVEAADPESASMWATLQKLEERSFAIARNLQAALTMFTDNHPQVRQLQQELRSVLEQAFQQRLHVQEREAAALQDRLSIIQARLRRRAELRERIIQRRINELTGGGDDTLWAPAPQHRPASVSSSLDPYGAQNTVSAELEEPTPTIPPPDLTDQPTEVTPLQGEDTPTFASSAVQVEDRLRGQQNEAIVINGTVFTGQKLIVTAFPPGTTPDGIGIRFENGEVTGARLLGTNTSSGLSLLQPGAVPDDIRGLNLAKGNPNTGMQIRVAWFEPDDAMAVADGLVSATNRTVNGKTVIQTDVATPASAAGAPLVNQQGQLIGIANGADTNASITFAVPTDAIRKLLSLVDVEPGGAGPPSIQADTSNFNPFAGSAEDLPMAEVAPLDLSIRKRLVEFRLRYRIAEREHERMELLRTNNAASQTELERAADTLKQAKVTLDETERLIQLQLEQLESRIRLARHSVEIAQHQVEAAEQANEAVPGAITLVEFLKLTLEVERARTGLHELHSLKTFLSDSLPAETPVDLLDDSEPSAAGLPQQGRVVPIPEPFLDDSDAFEASQEQPRPDGSLPDPNLLNPIDQTEDDLEPLPEPESKVDPFVP